MNITSSSLAYHKKHTIETFDTSQIVSMRIGVMDGLVKSTYLFLFRGYIKMGPLKASVMSDLNTSESNFTIDELGMKRLSHG
jgi:hypothetical protein